MGGKLRKSLKTVAICRRSSVMQFSPPLGPMFTKTKIFVNKRPRVIDALLDQMADKYHIKLDNREI